MFFWLINQYSILYPTKEKDIINGLKFRDQLSGNQIHINAKVVVNATGVFSDRLIALDQP